MSAVNARVRTARSRALAKLMQSDSSLTSCSLGPKGRVFIKSLGDLSNAGVDMYGEARVLIPHGFKHCFTMCGEVWGIQTRVCDGLAEFQLSHGAECTAWYARENCSKFFHAFARKVIPEFKALRSENVMVWIGVHFPNVQTLIRAQDPEAYDRALAAPEGLGSMPLALSAEAVQVALEPVTSPIKPKSRSGRRRKAEEKPSEVVDVEQPDASPLAPLGPIEPIHVEPPPTPKVRGGKRKREVEILSMGSLEKAARIEWRGQYLIVPDNFCNEFCLDESAWGFRTRIHDNNAEFQLYSDKTRSEWIVPSLFCERAQRLSECRDVERWFALLTSNVQRLIRESDPALYDAIKAGRVDRFEDFPKPLSVSRVH
jgi:hypothetical protein